MSGHQIPVRLVVMDDLEHVGVAQHGPPEQITMGDGTAAAHLVIDAALVREHVRCKRIPLSERRPFRLVVHFATGRYWRIRRSESADDGRLDTVTV